MKYIKISFILIITSVILFGACSKNKSTLSYEFNTDTKNPAVYPDVNFAVISDIHVYDSELGSTGEAFEKAMNADRKLLLDSEYLLDLAINNIIEQGADFVLISGDLTKDGETINHQIAAEKLKRLNAAAIPVFVIPGNHDYNNPDAKRFFGDKTEPVQAVSANEFVQIHSLFGYNNALFRDNGSLSYAAELADGLWLLALDSTRSRENVQGQGEIVGGKFTQETLDWMAIVLSEAAKQNKAVIAMMHHGAMEHWNGQSKLHPDYIIPDFKNFSKFLASWNVRIVFTGHYHANDITLKEFDDKFIYDIETGSLITSPCPMRYITINNNTMNIKTDFIVDKLYPGTDFAANADSFVKKTVMLEAASVLRRFKVSEKDIAIITDAVGDAFTAHYSGDENPAFRTVPDKSKLSLWGRFVLSQQQYVLNGLWQDLPPKDNDVSLNLTQRRRDAERN